MIRTTMICKPMIRQWTICKPTIRQPKPVLPGGPMRKTTLLLTLVVFGLASIINLNLHAGTLAGVTMPDTVQAAGTTLTLNGMGLRTKYAFKVYVAGLYLEHKSSDANAILKANAPRRLVMHFVRNVSQSQIADAFSEGFENNSPDAAKTMKPAIDRLLAALESVKDGEEMVFTYTPGTGTTFSLAGKDKVTIAGSAFAEVLFSVWLGPKPPNAALKKGILGQ
jgi:hypothetical protein